VPGAIGWEARPVTRGGYFRWDAPADEGEGVLEDVFADTAQDTVCIVGIDTNDGRGFDVYGNDLQILLRLLQLRREEGIGTLDAGKLV
jgi:hypothetical protein